MMFARITRAARIAARDERAKQEAAQRAAEIKTSNALEQMRQKSRALVAQLLEAADEKTLVSIWRQHRELQPEIAKLHKQVRAVAIAADAHQQSLSPEIIYRQQ